MQDKKEFIAIVKANEGIIFKITLVYAKCKEDQHDLYQEIVYQLWKSFTTFKNKSKISTWLYRVALNTSITHVKREKLSRTSISIDEVLKNRIEDNDTVTEERLSILYAYIKKLNTIEKGIVLLYLEGKNYTEISNITGFTISNVGTRLNRIKKKLKSQINKK